MNVKALRYSDDTRHSALQTPTRSLHTEKAARRIATDHALLNSPWVLKDWTMVKILNLGGDRSLPTFR